MQTFQKAPVRRHLAVLVQTIIRNSADASRRAHVSQTAASAATLARKIKIMDMTNTQIKVWKAKARSNHMPAPRRTPLSQHTSDGLGQGSASPIKPPFSFQHAPHDQANSNPRCILHQCTSPLSRSLRPLATSITISSTLKHLRAKKQGKFLHLFRRHIKQACTGAQRRESVCKTEVKPRTQGYSSTFGLNETEIEEFERKRREVEGSRNKKRGNDVAPRKTEKKNSRNSTLKKGKQQQESC